jgi:hypothetical protein
VTESRGTWNKVVQSINYVSTADNTRQPIVIAPRMQGHQQRSRCVKCSHHRLRRRS